MLQVERQTGRRPEALEPPTNFPVPLSHVWSAFIVLSNRRPSGFSGVSPITFEQIQAWKTLTETPLSPREVDVILKLDKVYMGVYNG